MIKKKKNKPEVVYHKSVFNSFFLFFPSQRNVYKSDKISFKKKSFAGYVQLGEETDQELDTHTVFHGAVFKPRKTHAITQSL